MVRHRCHTSGAESSLLERARQLSERATQFWAATGFVTSAAFQHLAEPLLERQHLFRFLTGTFGRATRKATFRRILNLSRANPSLQPRIWAWRGQFHAKLYLWKLGDDGVVWVGSPNLTDGGLLNEGEIVLEMRGRWDSSAIAAVRKSFEDAWKTSEPITEAFVRKYREAPRPPPDAKVSRKVPVRASLPGSGNRFFATFVSHHFADDSEVARRIERKLQAISDDWMRHFSAALSGAKRGDRCFIVDLVDGSAALGNVTAASRDGRGWVFWYDPAASIKWNKAARNRLHEAGLSLTTRGGVRTRWLDEERGKAVENAVKELRREQRR